MSRVTQDDELDFPDTFDSPDDLRDAGGLPDVPDVSEPETPYKQPYTVGPPSSTKPPTVPDVPVRGGFEGSTPGPGANSTLTPTSGSPGQTPSPTAAYLQSLIAAGMDPQAAIAQFNKETGRTTGNEAVYYGAEVHGVPTIGLPEDYLSLNNGAWGITHRTPETQKSLDTQGARNNSTTPSLAQQLGLGSEGSQSSVNLSGIESLLTQLLQGQQATAGDNATFRDSVRKSVLDSIDQYSKSPTADDESIAMPTAAYRNEGIKALGLEREALAERGAAQGLPQGALDAGVESGYENLGQKTGNYSANLLVDALKSQRDNLARSQALGAGLLSEQDSNDLRTKIAVIDGLIRKAGLGVTQELGQRGLDNQLLGINNSFTLGQGSLDNQRTGLNNQNSQFYDDLGFRIGSSGANMDERLLEMLLNGLGG